MSTFIDRFSIKLLPNNRNESKSDVLRKLSHLYMNGKHIEDIVSVDIL